jgi:type VI secretion system protein ImpM
MVAPTSLDGCDDRPDPRTGFFGKVTSHGDFVARRLAPSFQRQWDEWVQAGLRESRLALGPAWLPTYLSSPIWRFALAPGVCGEHAWAGLLMPSVDKVGRHFPLSLAAPLTGDATPLDYALRQHGWYDCLEQLALSSLAEDFSLEDFDAALSALAPAVPAGKENPGLLYDIAHAALHGQGVWWTDGSPRVAPCVLVCRGMPAPPGFTALLDGGWEGFGWQGANLTRNSVRRGATP